MGQRYLLAAIGVVLLVLLLIVLTPMAAETVHPGTFQLQAVFAPVETEAYAWVVAAVAAMILAAALGAAIQKIMG